VEIEIITLSRQGSRRYNEDVFGQWNDGRFVACLVADGAGGHGGGDVAAAIARGSVLEGFAACPGLDAELLPAIDLHEHLIAWAHSGDSRAYLFRDGALLARTTDHSLVQQMVAGGMIDEEGARLHPQRNMLLSALGSMEEPPEITVSAPMPLAEGDVLLLCSDGVWEPLGDDVLQETLQASPTPTRWVEQLDAHIRALAKPGQDNYTALALWAHADDETTRPMPEAGLSGA
jgi:serine/threonine protein phosphatase PrpC